MIDSVFKEGSKAWYDGKGFIENPFNIWYDEEKFTAWNQGWWLVQNEMYSKEKEVLDREYQLQLQMEREEKERVEKSKTKKGRAELAGQYTLFG